VTGAVPSPYHGPKALTADHDVSLFDCTKPLLDHWLKSRAIANEGRASRTYVMTKGQDVVAYYSLAAGSVTLAEMARKYRHNLPNPAPVMILGRLAVDHRHAGAGLGASLLRNAMQRTLSISLETGVRMLIVHAIDDEAAAFYVKYGFHAFPAGSRALFLPIETLEAAITPA
jgi:predicted GNAT family N-acyltransferase